MAKNGRLELSDYVVISHAYRYARISDDRIDKYMPQDLAPLVAYLVKHCGMKLEGLYLENYKAPETVVVMDGLLPIDLLKSQFGDIEGLRYGETAVISDRSFSSLEGTPKSAA